ncbi:hypothetical protein AB0I81_10375 [Nonomuraea sp. NPDC050404]|uniref:hypothetical protein n=1 Tax=Nonomuraea sp. NPDC050404 TaxID=3155783 RepID=UPI0033C0D526
MIIRRAAAALLAGCAATLTLAAPAQAAPPTVDLVRYYNGAKHWSTTGEVPGGYKREGAVTILAVPAKGAVPIYGCMAGYTKGDQFLSHKSDCGRDGHTVLRREGFVYAGPRPGFTRPIYRCYWPKAQSHFFSIAADCENTATTKVNAEFRIGYVKG